MGQIHQQSAGTCRGVIAAHAFDLATHALWHKDCRHDLGYGVRGVVLGVLAATVFVVVLDQVFKERRIEVIFLGKDALEAELYQRVDDGAAEIVPLGWVSDVLADPVKRVTLAPPSVLTAKMSLLVMAMSRNVSSNSLANSGAFWRLNSYAIKCSGLRRAVSGPSGVVASPGRWRSFRKCLFPACSLGQLGSDSLGLEGVLVIEKLVEKDLCDDLEFVAIIAQTIGGADPLEAVDHLPSAIFKILCYQVRTPVLLPEANSFMYSATTK